MGKINSRAKGAVGERQVAHIIEDELGFKVERGIQSRFGGKEYADVMGVPYLHLEVKRVERLNVSEAMKQSQRDAKEEEMPIVVHRKNREDWLVTLSLKDFINIYREWYSSKLLEESEVNNAEKRLETTK